MKSADRDIMLADREVKWADREVKQVEVMRSEPKVSNKTWGNSCARLNEAGRDRG